MLRSSGYRATGTKVPLVQFGEMDPHVMNTERYESYSGEVWRNPKTNDELLLINNFSMPSEIEVEGYRGIKPVIYLGHGISSVAFRLPTGDVLLERIEREYGLV